MLLDAAVGPTLPSVVVIATNGVTMSNDEIMPAISKVNKESQAEKGISRNVLSTGGSTGA